MSEIEVTAADRPIREINLEIRHAVEQGHAVTVRDTRSRHNMAVALPRGAKGPTATDP